MANSFSNELYKWKVKPLFPYLQFHPQKAKTVFFFSCVFLSLENTHIKITPVYPYLHMWNRVVQSSLWLVFSFKNTSGMAGTNNIL